MKNTPLVLIILDGWGYRAETNANAIALARKPNYDALLRMAKQNGVDRLFVHALMDGRDTLPTSGAGYIEQLQQKMRELGTGHVASVSGRYYAMDRDKRWEREQKAFDALVKGKAEG